MANTGEAQPITGRSDKNKIETEYTVCHNILRKAICIPLRISIQIFTEIKWIIWVLLIMASVFSLNHANTGEPIMRNKYLNHEK